MSLDLLVGSGGVLSHAPRRVQAAMMMLDAFVPEGVTELAVDSIFMMPQLGVLAEVDNQMAKKAATDVFINDCLIRLGSAVAAVGEGKDGARCLKVQIAFPGGKSEAFELPFGSIRRVPLGEDEKAEVTVEPAGGFDVGAGKGKMLKRTLGGGIVGLVFDARGRPFRLPEDPARRIEKLSAWSVAMDLYAVDPKTLA